MEKIEYQFKSGLKATGTFAELEKIASALGETLDITKLGGKCPKGYYPSETKGMIKISDMNDYHLRRALLKVTKEYFGSIFAADDSNAQFLQKYVAMSDSQLVNDIFAELKKRA